MRRCKPLILGLSLATATVCIREIPRACAFVPCSQQPKNDAGRRRWRARKTKNQRSKPQGDSNRDDLTKTFAVDVAIDTLMAGSLAGAVGVGVSFPLDTLKTKIIQQQTNSADNVMSAGTDSTAVLSQQGDSSSTSMLRLAELIYDNEGLGGFFCGVGGMMAGQAVVKAVAFSANAIALDVLDANIGGSMVLFLAACFAGFVTSFVVTSVERIKVVMQASRSLYRNELECVQAILEIEGFEGLMGRGLGATMAREIPGYGIYFGLYGVLTKTALAAWLGPTLSPLLFGAVSGSACWIAVLPMDVVKTLVSTSVGSTSSTKAPLEITKQLFEKGGIGVFFEGLQPTVLRAIVAHSVTFYMYELVMNVLDTQTTLEALQ